jgi:hypothetical protein
MGERISQKLAAILPDGREEVIWEGTMDREDTDVGRVESSFPSGTEINTDRIKVYLDTTRVAGWNEIDAVEIVTPLIRSQIQVLPPLASS